jgi:aryl-alcohol dehydrogenase-like predicted oxidoreductase
LPRVKPEPYNPGMEKRTLGRTGLIVSVIGLGTAPAAFLKTESERFALLLNQLLDAGVNLIDTAAGYPDSEKTLGRLIVHRRNEFVLVSKCGQKNAEIDAPAWSDSLITQTVDRALKHLGTPQIDVMLLHSCDLSTLQKGEAIGALAKAKQAGKIKHLGYSGDNEAAAYAAGLADVEVIETSVNIVDQINIDLVLPVAVKNKVGVIAKRPIANAAWKDLKDQPGMYQSYAKTYTDRLAKLDLKPADFGFGDWLEPALRFTLAQPGVTTAIIGTTNPTNAMKNLEIAAKGPLDATAVAKIREAFKQADPQGQWSGQQ